MRTYEYQCDGCQAKTTKPDGWIVAYTLDADGLIEHVREANTDKHYCVNCQDRMILKW